jgi:hypothetical protein
LLELADSTLPTVRETAKAGLKIVEQAQKTEAMRCMQVIAMAHEQKKFSTSVSGLPPCALCREV